MPDDVRVRYQEELARLEELALDGLNLVTESLDRALEAVEHQDMELAGLVVVSDDILDGRYLEVHQSLLTMIATQAPVATDLRLISALLHIMKNMERMGDQCVNIAKLIPIVGHEPPADERMHENILEMGAAGPLADRPGQARFRRARRRLGARSRPPGRRDRRSQPRVLPDRNRDRR